MSRGHTLTAAARLTHAERTEMFAAWRALNASDEAAGTDTFKRLLIARREASAPLVDEGEDGNVDSGEETQEAAS